MQPIRPSHGVRLAMTEEDLVSVEEYRTDAYRTRRRPARAGVILAAALGLAAAGLAPSRAQDCGAPACLAVDLSPELAAQLESGQVALDALAGGLALSYAGANPIPVRLIAARYDDGRLVRYGVSGRTQVSAAEPVAIADAATALTRGFLPATHRTVAIKAVSGSAELPIALASFVGNVPPTNLGGEPGKSLMTPEQAAAYSGSIGVILLEPDDPALRDGVAAASVGAIVQLELVRP